MTRLQSYLIAARFLSTIFHLLVILVIFSTLKSNVEIALTDYASDEYRLQAETECRVFNCTK